MTRDEATVEFGIASDHLLVIEALYDHKDRLVMSPRVTYLALKDRLDWESISNTRPDCIWDRYVFPHVAAMNVKVFARGDN